MTDDDITAQHLDLGFVIYLHKYHRPLKPDDEDFEMATKEMSDFVNKEIEHAAAHGKPIPHNALKATHYFVAEMNKRSRLFGAWRKARLN